MVIPPKIFLLLVIFFAETISNISLTSFNIATYEKPTGRYHRDADQELWNSNDISDSETVDDEKDQFSKHSKRHIENQNLHIQDAGKNKVVNVNYNRGLLDLDDEFLPCNNLTESEYAMLISCSEKKPDLFNPKDKEYQQYGTFFLSYDISLPKSVFCKIYISPYIESLPHISPSQNLSVYYYDISIVNNERLISGLFSYQRPTLLPEKNFVYTLLRPVYSIPFHPYEELVQMALTSNRILTTIEDNSKELVVASAKPHNTHILSFILSSLKNDDENAKFIMEHDAHAVCRYQSSLSLMRNHYPLYSHYHFYYANDYVTQVYVCGYERFEIQGFYVFPRNKYSLSSTHFLSTHSKDSSLGDLVCKTAAIIDKEATGKVELMVLTDKPNVFIYSIDQDLHTQLTHFIKTGNNDNNNCLPAYKIKSYFSELFTNSFLSSTNDMIFYQNEIRNSGNLDEVTESSLFKRIYNTNQWQRRTSSLQLNPSIKTYTIDNAQIHICSDIYSHLQHTFDNCLNKKARFTRFSRYLHRIVNFLIKLNNNRKSDYVIDFKTFFDYIMRSKFFNNELNWKIFFDNASTYSFPYWNKIISRRCNTFSNKLSRKISFGRIPGNQISECLFHLGQLIPNPTQKPNVWKGFRLKEQIVNVHTYREFIENSFILTENCTVCNSNTALEVIKDLSCHYHSNLNVFNPHIRPYPHLDYYCSESLINNTETLKIDPSQAARLKYVLTDQYMNKKANEEALFDGSEDIIWIQPFYMIINSLYGINYNTYVDYCLFDYSMGDEDRQNYETWKTFLPRNNELKYLNIIQVDFTDNTLLILNPKYRNDDNINIAFMIKFYN